MSDYAIGSDILGDMGTGGAPSVEGPMYGPLSPAQLAELDRKLTPAEQKAVSDWQSKQADEQLASVRRQGGPRSQTVSVTERGAIIKADPSFLNKPAFAGLKVWQAGLGALGIIGIAAGIVLATGGRR